MLHQRDSPRWRQRELLYRIRTSQAVRCLKISKILASDSRAGSSQPQHSRGVQIHYCTTQGFTHPPLTLYFCRLSFSLLIYCCCENHELLFAPHQRSSIPSAPRYALTGSWSTSDAARILPARWVHFWSLYLPSNVASLCQISWPSASKGNAIFQNCMNTG